MSGQRQSEESTQFEIVPGLIEEVLEEVAGAAAEFAADAVSSLLDGI